MKHVVFFPLILSLFFVASCGSEIPSSTDALSTRNDEKSVASKTTKTLSDTKDASPAVAATPGFLPPSSAVLGGDSSSVSESPIDGMASVATAPFAPGADASLRDEGSVGESDTGPINVTPSADLTAGSFDDALNLDIFTDYWADSSLAEANIKGLEQPNWNELIPANDSLTYDSLDLSFVIDVTGSMADELSYLQSEIDSIASNIAELFPNIKQRYSLVVYRDDGDDFVAKKFDFTEELSKFQVELNGQRATGGGDYPEAMHQALAESIKLEWGNDNSAKLLFLIADAPPHDDKIEETFNNVFVLKDKKVNIYPIAASGVALLAESIMRTSALLTGGQYIFLTDDSGIGNPHAEPKFPCYYVEKLKDVIVRAIGDELLGKRSEPTEENIIRTVGHPSKGVCRDQ